MWKKHDGFVWVASGFFYSSRVLFSAFFYFHFFPFPFFFFFLASSRRRLCCHHKPQPPAAATRHNPTEKTGRKRKKKVLLLLLFVVVFSFFRGDRRIIILIGALGDLWLRIDWWIKIFIYTHINCCGYNIVDENHYDLFVGGVLLLWVVWFFFARRGVSFELLWCLEYRHQSIICCCPSSWQLAAAEGWPTDRDRLEQIGSKRQYKEEDGRKVGSS